MKLLGNRHVVCKTCNKKTNHGHKPKNEWQVEGPLCGDCYVSQMKKFYELSQRQKCIICGNEKDVPDMWEPRYQWDMKGLLCKLCFDKKETEYKNIKTFCVICGRKLGMFRYNPKKKWSIDGQLCRECWDEQKAKMG